MSFGTEVISGGVISKTLCSEQLLNSHGSELRKRDLSWSSQKPCFSALSSRLLSAKRLVASPGKVRRRRGDY